MPTSGAFTRTTRAVVKDMAVAGELLPASNLENVSKINPYIKRVFYFTYDYQTNIGDP